LDVKIVREVDKLNTSLYRKATDSGRYLNITSNHPRSVKVRVATCLLLRAETNYSNGKSKSMEINHIKTTLKNNGYPSRVLREIERKKEKEQGTEKKNEFEEEVVIPYVAGLSEAIRRAGDDVGYRRFSLPVIH
jgi:hypothetical protein